MTGFLNSLMEGQNLSELNQMAVDGDPKHLGVVGRNLQLMAINNRAAAEAAIVQREPVEDPAVTAARDAASREEFYERQQHDRMEAMRRTGFKLMPKAQRVAAIPDSDEAVDDFVRNLW